jgi:aarF domain-containing kinase
MLEVVRHHNMKLDGDISILLTNMLVLEGIAKDLDPDINILRCAVPYLRYN